MTAHGASRHRWWARRSMARSVAKGLLIGAGSTLLQLALVAAALLYAGIIEL